MTRFKELQIEGWRQFGSVQIEFHPRATVITGANGSGKTTLLSILSQHFGWAPSFIGTPRIDRRGALKYFSGFYSVFAEGNIDVGKLTYDDGAVATLQSPAEGASFRVSIRGSQRIRGIYITSHRPVYTYQPVKEIPTEVQAGDQLFDQYLTTIRQYHQPNTRIQSPSHRLKAALISLATFGYGNKVVEPNDEASETFEGFSKVLNDVLPPNLGFSRIAIRMPEVILETETGDFSLDAASGGIAALVDVAWQIYMRSRSGENFTVLIDEPENHLHPSLQRSVLPGLLAAFSQAQFIISTHNPFVVTSVRDSNVIALDFVDGRVQSANLLNVNRSANANQILTEVLGVPFPVPLWVEDEVEKIVNSVRDEDLTAELLATLKERLNLIGLGHLFPEVIDRLLPTGETDQGDSR
ncbi:MAG: AAA family ATPase [Caldilineaceae bacterium SB0661_bin_32]|uniref:AAA family ATPase n=1 Tax=Caldilineaceae bacterium SB0661_bin_32 TaxID=2605255 RepID=A0A6B1DA65_9CHLR|nr:AAA family ATPase [Caldilineaceae bacterium SB0661_bin_32]